MNRRLLFYPNITNLRCIIEYVCSIFRRYVVLSPFFIVYSSAAAHTAEHKIDIKIDHFSKHLDFVNYLDKINTSSIPEELYRSQFGYAYIGSSHEFGGSVSHEVGNISRPVEPLSIENTFTQYELYLSKFNWNRKHQFSLHAGIIEQEDISLDCVQRGNVLLGGSCDNADFRLLDGDYLEQSGSRRYLPVLDSSASAIYAKLIHTLNYYTSKYKHSINTVLSIHQIEHHTESPLFALTSDFLLDSQLQGQSLRNIISDLQAELPQQKAWYDITLDISVESAYKVGDGSVYGQIGLLYSEKLDYESDQQYKQNTYIKLGYQTELIERLSINVSGIAYQHYLQGVQPILYTPKTAKFFAHPYGEISIGMTYHF